MFDRFDILSAYYVYGSDYHTGQFSKEYAYMGRALKLGFRPSDSLSYESLSENGKEIYDMLVAQRRSPFGWKETNSASGSAAQLQA